MLYTMSEYVGGKLSNATNNQATYIGGMIIIDLLTQTARNVSTVTLGAPSVAGGLVHTPRFGKTENGTLVAFGGMQSKLGVEEIPRSQLAFWYLTVLDNLWASTDVFRLTSKASLCATRSMKIK